MKRPPLIWVLLIWVMSTCLYAPAQSDTKQAQPKLKGQPVQTASNSNLEGEKRFQTHCGRCHNPPETLSPRVARAVVRQMRVRARLSSEDEKLILQYLAP